MMKFAMGKNKSFTSYMIKKALKSMIYFKNHLQIIFLAIIVLNPFFAIEAQQHKFKVVIDAGHGGHDTGTTGTGRMKKREKDVALAVAKLVAAKLKAYKDIQPILTRDKDVFLELYQRAEIANKNKADLFVSIHCNANKNKRASGSETFVLGVHRNKDNLEVAKRENSVIKLESDNKFHYEGFDPDHPETFIGLTLMQEEFLDQSIMLASMIQKEYKKRLQGIKDRSVQQAGFAVLRLTYMPSVLTEIGFLTNPTEEKFLNSKTGQNKIATAIANAIVKYKEYINYNTPQAAAVTKANNPKIANNTTKNSKSAKTNQTASSKKTNTYADIDFDHLDLSKVVYKVQLMATSKRIPLIPENFRGLKDLSMIKENGMYKYFAGHTNDFDKIREIKGEARYKSFRNAFIVAYINGQRIPLSKILK
jgi:N-acetylmuramoyl-L-alanine amidase